MVCNIPTRNADVQKFWSSPPGAPAARVFGRLSGRVGSGLHMDPEARPYMGLDECVYAAGQSCLELSHQPLYNTI